MSYHVFFAFSSGFVAPISAPKGTLASIVSHVEHVETTLGLKRTRYQDNPAHWDWHDPAYRAGFPDVDDKLLCETVREHNEWVRRLYDRVADWAKNPVADGEVITPEDAATFWHGLQQLTIGVNRWSEEYYRNRMEHFYEVMRGRESEGVTWPADAPLTPEQAGAVVWLFGFLDPGDARLEVARGEDHLSDGDEYTWCERCGAIPDGDAEECREKGCPVQRDWCDEDRPDWYQDAEA
jgi:hypothetical protein